MKNEINNYIRHLEYDPVQLLAVPGDIISESVPYKEKMDGETYILCTEEKKDINAELFDIALLNALDGAIYPGATVKINQAFAGSNPTPVTCARAPLTLITDLPSDDQKAFIIQEPTNSSVQAAISKSIGNWLNDPKGYTVASKQQFSSTDAYSTNQIALSLGINANSLSATLKSKLSVDSKKTKSCVIAMYKQIFYTVSMDSPHIPADLFDDGVTLEDVQMNVDNKNPLGYIRSVAYGRIFFVKIESEEHDLKTKFHVFLEASKKTTKASVDLEASYNEFMKKSSMSVITLGGNAEASAKVMGAADLKQFLEIIHGGAEFKKNNLGVPIAYTAVFAKDNSMAKIMSSTQYVKKNYKIYKGTHIVLAHRGAYIAEAILTCRKRTLDSAGNPTLGDVETYSTGRITAPKDHTWNLHGAYTDIYVDAGEMDALMWHKWQGKKSWRQIFHKRLDQKPNIKIRIGGTTCSPSHSIE